MILPPFLKKGDCIGLAAPARSMCADELKPAENLLRSWGLEVVHGQHLFGRYHQFSGSDEERAMDFQTLLDDSSIKAILCVRGGYGTVRMIPSLDFTQFILHPKWIIGYSDITVLHLLVNQQFGIATMHATMPLNFPPDSSESISTTSLKNLLFGNPDPVQFSTHPLNRNGDFSGTITGGNLSVIYSLRGTGLDIDTKGKILFIEDIDEYLYHIDRMMMNLLMGGKLKELKGLLVGWMTDTKDNAMPFGQSAWAIIAGAAQKYDYPVIFGFPAGHQEPNYAFISGGTMQVTTSDAGVEVKLSI